MNLHKVQPPVALVTGAARRIGAAIVKHLHQHGFAVVIHYHQSDKEAHALMQQLNGIKAHSALTLKANLTEQTACLDLIKKAHQWKNKLSLVVNNASIFKRTDVHASTDEHFEALFTTNVKAPLWLSKAAYPYLAENHGSIVNITDIHAHTPLKGYSSYCQSKAALWMQTKCLAREFAPLVRVNAVAPGAIAWPEHENTLNDQLRQEIIAKTPLKQHGHPSYIAQAVLSLVQNAFITGERLRVDGGREII